MSGKLVIGSNYFCKVIFPTLATFRITCSDDDEIIKPLDCQFGRPFDIFYAMIIIFFAVTTDHTYHQPCHIFLCLSGADQALLWL